MVCNFLRAKLVWLPLVYIWWLFCGGIPHDGGTECWNLISAICSQSEKVFKKSRISQSYQINLGH